MGYIASTPPTSPLSGVDFITFPWEPRKNCEGAELAKSACESKEAGKRKTGWIVLGLLGLLGLTFVFKVGTRRKNPGRKQRGRGSSRRWRRRNAARRRRRNQLAAGPRRARKHRPRTKKWMKGAVKHPGALRSWVARRYGDAGFDSKGRIKMSVLRKHYNAPGTLGKRVRLAVTFRGGL